jgi:hypothetical protein
MKNTTQILLIYCIFAIVGHDAVAQNGFSQDELREFNRAYRESQEMLRLENQRIAQFWRDNTKTPEYDDVPLRYTICMNRPGKYKLGEPVFIHDHVRNLSDFWVWITVVPPRYLFSTVRVSLVDAAGNEVPTTCAGRHEDECVKNGGKVAGFREEDRLQYFLSPQNRSPRNEKELKPGPIVLNHYFDLTRPGVYHLTFHRLSFGATKILNGPLSSNTLTFEVLEEFVTPEDLKDPGEFNWPPPEKPDETPPSQPPDAVKPVVE